MSKVRKNLGKWGENVAKEFLLKNGYKVETSNYRTKGGEIDLICWDKSQIVFVEIKTSRSSLLKAPQDGYSKKQQNRLRFLAQKYISTHKFGEKPEAFRFDFIGIKINKNISQITHLKNILFL